MDPIQLVSALDLRLAPMWRLANARAATFDFSQEEEFLASLQEALSLRVEDRLGALEALAKLRVTVLRELWDEVNPEVQYRREFSQSEPPLPNRLVGVAGPMLSEYVETFIGKKRFKQGWADTFRSTVREFIQLVGDKPVTAYSKDDGQRYIDLLLVLPANRMKLRSLRDLGLAAAAERAVELGLKPQHTKTLRKKRGVLVALFEAAASKHGPIGVDFSLEEAPDEGDEERGKSPFTSSELQILFDQGMPVDLFWITAMCLYSGARCNEVAQLHRKHIEKVASGYSMSFDSQMMLKETSCLRKVPLHPTLLELGLMTYVETQTDRLFPNTKASVKTGRYSDAIGKHFARLLKKAGLKRPDLSFHSLRHTFIDQLKLAAPKYSEVRERIVGHALPGIGGLYGSSFKAEFANPKYLALKAPVVALVEYDLILRPPEIEMPE